MIKKFIINFKLIVRNTPLKLIRFFSFHSKRRKKNFASAIRDAGFGFTIMKTVIVETMHVRKGSAEARRGGRGAARSGRGGARRWAERRVTRRSCGSVTARRYLRTPNRTPSPSLCEATCLWFRGKDRTSGTWGRVLSSERIQPSTPATDPGSLEWFMPFVDLFRELSLFLSFNDPPPFVFYGAAWSYAKD